MSKSEDTISRIREYFSKNDLKKAIVGVSGGIDSAMTLILTIKALGVENVHAILSPSRHTSQESTENAKHLCRALDVHHKIIPIEYEEDGVWKGVIPEKIRRLEHHYPEPKQHTLENMQAIDRMAILRAVANEVDAIVMGTGNRTELYFGYFTLGGDGEADLFPLITWSKGEVYEYAKTQEHIPKFIIERKPSAELSTDQVDPFDYDEADLFLKRFIDEKKDEAALEAEFGKEKTSHYLSLIRKNRHKRDRMNDLLILSSPSS